MSIEPRFDMIDNGNGTWTVKDVPVFATCRYGPREFNEAWVDKALANMLAEQAGGHVFPMHIHHTTDETAVVEPAGAFKVTRKGPVRLRDKTEPGLIGDLTFTNPDAAKRCKQFQLLWRSPEIPKSGPERLRSLALLDREAPHLPMEVLAVRDAAKTAGTKYEPTPAPTWTLAAGEAVHALAESGEAIYALMEGTTTMAVAEPKPRYRRKADGTLVLLSPSGAEEVIHLEEEKEKPPFEKKADADKGASEEPKGESGEGEGDKAPKGDPVDALLEKIRGLKLTREQHQKLEAGIADIFKSEAPITDSPGDVTMKDKGAGKAGTVTENVEVVKLREEVTATAARLSAVESANKARAEADARAAAVDRGMGRLNGRRTPSDQRERLLAFAEAHGAKGVDALVEQLVATLPPVSTSLSDALKGEPTDGTPAEVLAFHAKGPDAYAAAQREARLHATLCKTYWKDGGAPSLKDYLALKIGDGSKAFRAGFSDDTQE